MRNHESKRVYVYNKTRETFVATSATVADTYMSRLVGLLGRTRRWVRPGQGLWIVPSYGVHTIGMLFSIDLVFLDRANHVVHIEEHVRPFRISKVILKADSVLELPPHTIFRTRTHVGDLLEIGPLPTPSKSRSASAQSTLNGVPKYVPSIRA
ncbi:MAG: DUF192 domain-containing protein [Acidobacteria bacterium]|nr:DUF192 domain-containing protein [Acidobacteriota bacterium]